MNILNSPWLIKMLAKSSKTPRGRLLSLVDTLEDWLDAPNIAADIRKQVENNLQTQVPEKNLLAFLTLEASKAGAAMPEMLASQLYFMAVAATQEKLQAGIAQSLRHARSAANALISAQTKTEFHIAKPTAYALATTFAS